MAYQLDHIVIGVNNLDAATASFRQAGFEVTPGGEHSSGNTHNALVTFKDGAYLELIAFKDQKIEPEHKWGKRLAQGEGFLDFALAGSDLESEAKRLDGAGIAHNGVRPLGRLRPDGQRIDWLLLNPDNDTYPIPFLIDDITPRELRVPGGSAAEHTLGAGGVSGVRLLVKDLKQAAAKFAALLDTSGNEVEPVVEGGASARRFTLGSQWIELIQPAPEASDLLAYLAERGSAPFEIVLTRGDAGATDGELLPLEGTHQARIKVS